MKRLARHRRGMLGGVVVAAMVLAGVLAPAIAPYSYSTQSLLQRLQPPSDAHWLGTDSYGRDVLTRVIWGSRVSLEVGFLATMLAVLVGTVVGGVAGYFGAPVRFYKRAQILVADLHGAFAGQDLGSFSDLDILTAFADYKVPQVLRALGVLAYDPKLAERIARREIIPPGSPAEVEIRAATIWACELLRRALAERGQSLRTFEIDWALWNAGQALPPETPPYHRTPTIFY